MNKFFARAFFLAALTITCNARAYCQTTTCAPNYSCAEFPDDCCSLDEDGCDMNGIPVHWPNACVSFNVQKDGSKKRRIAGRGLEDALDRAFDSWLSTECSNGPVSLAVENRGNAKCGTPEYNIDDGAPTMRTSGCFMTHAPNAKLLTRRSRG